MYCGVIFVKNGEVSFVDICVILDKLIVLNGKCLIWECGEKIVNNKFLIKLWMFMCISVEIW